MQLFIAGFLAGWGLHSWLEFSIDGAGASTLQKALGASAIVVGLAITWWALSTFMRVRTGIMPDRPARQTAFSIVEGKPNQRDLPRPAAGTTDARRRVPLQQRPSTKEAR